MANITSLNCITKHFGNSQVSETKKTRYQRCKCMSLFLWLPQMSGGETGSWSSLRTELKNWAVMER